MKPKKNSTGTKGKSSASQSNDAKPKRTPAPRKSAEPAASPELPPFLLEGDRPETPAASGPGEKFALGPTPPEQQFESAEAELPESYGTKRLFLTARDPHWLYANWDLTPEQQKRYNSLSADKHLVLRIYAGTAEGEPVSQVHVHPESRHWFAHVEQRRREILRRAGLLSQNAGRACLDPGGGLRGDADPAGFGVGGHEH